MNRRQLIALTHPCARPEQTAQRMFHDSDESWSTILTVNL